MNIYAENLFYSDHVQKSMVINVEDGVINRIEPGSNQSCLSAENVAMGFIDPHIHGGAGFDIMDFEASELREWLAHLFNIGVTAVLPSVYTFSVPVMRKSLLQIKEAVKLQAANLMGGAKIIGVHLEGPFISHLQLGAMEESFVLAPDIEKYKEVTDGCEDIIRIVTLAPEVHGADRLIGYLKQKGVRVLAGHTDASYEEGLKAFDTGVSGICHFYNASRGIHHREPGILASAMMSPDIRCELIGDMVHVHPALMNLLMAVKKDTRISLISDAVKTTGLPDGEYLDGIQTIIVKNGESRLKNGKLNGGSCMLPLIVKKLMADMRLDIHSLIKMASYSTRAYLGVNTEIEAGKTVDLIGMDKNLNLLWTLLGNETHKRNEAVL